MKFKDYLKEEEIIITKNKWDVYADSLKSAKIPNKWKSGGSGKIIITISPKDKKKAIEIAKAVKAL